MRIGDFHAVDFYEYEVVELFCLDAGVQLTDYLSDGCGFPGAWDARDIDAGACPGGDCGFEVGVDGGKFGRSAGESERNRRDVEGAASELERRGRVRGREVPR